MISIQDFEGIAGFRWGAHVQSDGRVDLSNNAPNDCRKQVAFMVRLLSASQSTIGQADFVFEKGKVLLRAGAYGTFILFCDLETNTSLYGFVLADTQDAITTHDSDSLHTEMGSTRSGALNIHESVTIHAQPVPQEIIDELLAYYIEVLGPLAPALAKKEATKNQIDLERVLSNQWSSLLNALADRISDSTKSETFLDKAVMLKTRF